MTRTQGTDGGGSYVTLRKYEYNNEGRPEFFLVSLKRRGQILPTAVGKRSTHEERTKRSAYVGQLCEGGA